jgi:hypothetical protein
MTSKDYYFDSYAHFGIHEEMLKDEVGFPFHVMLFKSVCFLVKKPHGFLRNNLTPSLSFFVYDSLHL